LYHGKLKFPAEFPFKPPSIYMITPNGRFKTNTRLCLSISDFHPDTWNPAWSVGTILTGLLSFMLEKSPTLGSLETNDLEKKSLAYKSIEFNLKDKVVLELFPEIVEEMREIVRNREKNVNSQQPVEYNNNHSMNLKYGNTSTVSSVLATAVVAVGFAFFALTVKYVIKSINYE
jgi:ubiquitin-conjugating enzyme E2 J2